MLLIKKYVMILVTMAMLTTSVGCSKYKHHFRNRGEDYRQVTQLKPTQFHSKHVAPKSKRFHIAEVKSKQNTQGEIDITPPEFKAPEKKKK